MKGHPDVVDYLKVLLRGELAARDQYFIHSRRYEDMGLMSLYERINHEMQEETEHADALLRRILFLEGDPDMRPDEFIAGYTVEEMLQRDLEVEYRVRAALAEGMALCERVGDFVSREILRVQLQDTEEDHAHWLEQQLGLIKRLGIQNYLTARLAQKPSQE
ncbi:MULTISPECIES: bacterioferritin [Lysobacter]|uniref:Bacterioferritin n=1 Tax=Lysobacter soli TaxID=453783 RepID=A0A3D8VJR6_9GAMM|nr:bacterioferritin [Lysobacter soli]MDG2516442.1 bacterioferritin [Lysobacter soli]RDY69597.1 bacterioferritin [Lysobacter soli]